MGRLTYETYDPDDLELPNDTDFELEGIDEAYGEYQEYAAFLPDRIARLRPMDMQATDACEAASASLASVYSNIAASEASDVMARLLLYVEAVATVQIEGYATTCAAMLDYAAAASAGLVFLQGEAEEAAVDAVDALRAFVSTGEQAITLDALCEANALFSQSSASSEYCGALRERPVFIGGSLFDAEYVPPPADALDDYMDDLVRFVNARNGANPVAKAAVSHAQLVAIHPFEDGNGRTGRALSQRVLCTEGPTRGLILPIAAAIARRKSDYIDALQCMQCSSGPSDPSRFIVFFAASCEDAACRALAMSQHVGTVLAHWTSAMPAADAAIQKALHVVAATPVMTETMLASELPQYADTALDDMLRANILQRRRSDYGGVDIYVANDILDLLDS